MLFYRNILSQNLFTYLPCCFYRNILVTKFAHLTAMLFYRNILSQNLFTYLPCCFIVHQPHFVLKFLITFFHLPTMLFYRKHFVTKYVHLPTMLFYRNIVSKNLFT